LIEDMVDDSTPLVRVHFGQIHYKLVSYFLIIF